MMTDNHEVKMLTPVEFMAQRADEARRREEAQASTAEVEDGGHEVQGRNFANHIEEAKWRWPEEGTAKTHPGGVQWAVCRHDLNEDNSPVFMPMASEEEARRWHTGLLAMWETSTSKDEVNAPELVSARLYWVVQDHEQ